MPKEVRKNSALKVAKNGLSINCFVGGKDSSQKKMVL